jgi:hypothetical protein
MKGIDKQVLKETIAKMDKAQFNVYRFAASL